MRCIVSFVLCVAILGSASGASVDGVEIYWESHGEGPAIVLIHGWTCDTTVWADQVAGFSDDYRVIALDLPGHGQSGAPANEAFTTALYSDAIEAVLVEAGVERAVLVGHSMGVPVIANYARAYPDRVAALVSVDGPDVPQPQSPSAAPAAEEAAAPAQPFAMDRDAREAAIRSFFVPATSEDIREQVLDIMLAPSDERAAAIITPFFNPASESLLVPEPQFRHLIVFAGNRPPMNAEVLRERTATTQFVQMPETGHFLMMEQPVQFNAEMAAFLDDIEF